MGRRRFWLVTCAGALAVLLILGSYAGYRAQRLLNEQGIVLDWRAWSLSPRSLRLDGFSLQQHSESAHLQLLGGSLQLYWLASEAPRYRLLLQDVHLDWQPTHSSAEVQPPADPLAMLERLGEALPWLPRLIELQRVEAQLPCASGRCPLHGDLHLQLRRDGLHLVSRLQRSSHRAELQAELQRPASAAPWQLDAALLLDGHAQLRLHSQLYRRTDATHWSGRLSVPQLGEVAWFGDWLSQWLLLDPPALPTTPQQARLDAQWQVQLPPGAWQLDSLLGAPGWLRLDAQLPQAWPLPELGRISGTLALDLHNSRDQWQARELRADLLLDPRGAPWLNTLPGDLRPEQLRLQIEPRQPAGTAAETLDLLVRLEGQGPLQLRGDAEIELQLQAHWALTLASLRLEASAARARLAGSRLDELQLTLQASGRADAQQLDFSLGDGARIAIARLAAGAVELQRLHGELSGIRLHGAPQAPQVDGPLTLRTQRLRHARLKPQGWQWRGTLQANRERQALNGALQADSGLELAVQANRNAKGELHASAQLAELFLRAGNPLAKILAEWPALLSLDNGRVHGEAQLRLPPARPLQAQVTLSGRGLSGIYDRSSFSGFDGELRLNIDDQRLALELPQLTIRQIDPGIALGPLQLQARYQADLARPLAGRLQHQRAELGVLGGQLSLAPAHWLLDGPSLVLPLRLRGLDLQQLFRVYPAEGLEGDGLLDGLLPLRLGAGGASVEQGLIEARAPGGRLRFHSPRIQAMGQANPGMKLVADALEDFHYDLLSSSLDYDQSGTLRLGLRLQGQSPAIERGRPIHFSINLEEDVPSLLASLQLSAKVSDIIQRRIQQRMRERVPQATKE